MLDAHLFGSHCGLNREGVNLRRGMLQKRPSFLICLQQRQDALMQGIVTIAGLSQSYLKAIRRFMIGARL